MGGAASSIKAAARTAARTAKNVAKKSAAAARAAANAAANAAEEAAAAAMKSAAKAQEKAKELADQKKTEVDTLMAVLETKLKTFELMVLSHRGDSESTTEVDGGRTVMRMSAMRIQTDDGPEQQMKAAIASFIQVAQGGNKAKEAAVVGAEKMLSSGIDALFGVAEGSAMEKQGFAVMFLNYAFVRVDYYVYSYRVSAKKGGGQSGTAGFCYFADLAVLKLGDMNSSEIDFLISQSLAIEDTSERINRLTEIKIQMAQSAVLSRILSDSQSNLGKIAKATQAYVTTAAKIQKSFKALPDYDEEAEAEKKKAAAA
jgi:hypothetical protein